MNEQIDLILYHMAKSQRELAKILKTERELATHAAGLIVNIPEGHMANAGVEGVRDQSMQVSKSIAVYLNGLADLEEALADNMGPVIKELEGQEEE
ncbi:MAG: nucleoside-diphosphate sugar epimerase [Paenibacillaceae bacterium]|jgi:hypothetical protein|nr:nucleoside-diphosphate sugar epimerase [Paenibacillaceae bacterium]